MRCAAQLGARRGVYRTADSVADIEALRAEAGYARLAIYGVSYGTKVALAYAAAHPDRVERLVLDSPVAPEGPDVLQRSTFAAIPRVLGELCAHDACGGITHDPAGALRDLVARLQRGPLRGRYVDERGRSHAIAITREGVLSVLLHGDTNPALRADVPAALGAWRRGDRRPLARLVAHAGGRVTLGSPEMGVDPALYAATVCEELSFPWDRAAGAAARSRQAARIVRDMPPADFLPFDRATALRSEVLALCLGWRTASPTPAAAGALPPVPALILAGGGDLRTPVEDARAVAARLPLAPQVVTIPWVGHSVLSSEMAKEECAAAALAAFFADAAIPGCTTARAPIDLAPRPPRGSPSSPPSARCAAASDGRSAPRSTPSPTCAAKRSARRSSTARSPRAWAPCAAGSPACGPAARCGCAARSTCTACGSRAGRRRKARSACACAVARRCTERSP